ncbi:MAG: phloretin hydrolase [Oscillospiraceae bacterium]|nr:phloretin hydrolase [Oscillospiraceae bacterium]
MGKKVPATNEDRKKSYFKYYLQEVSPGDPEKCALITPEPYDNATALRIENRNDLFLPGALPCEFGWWQLEDGTALIANRTLMPGVTGEMFDWWFAWHPIYRLRYAIWDNEDHYDVYVDDPAHTRDMSLSMRERHWDSIHNIWEDIGTGQVDLLRIHFRNPADMGYDASKLDTDACNALVAANVIVVGSGDMPDVPVVMTHFLRPVEGGSELRSRFWFGWQIIDGKPVKSIPDGVKVPSMGPVCLLNHNVKEFSNLARILPLVYAEEKDNWL